MPITHEMPLFLHSTFDEARVGNPFFKRLPPYNFPLSLYVANDENDKFLDSEKETSGISILFGDSRYKHIPI